MRAIRPYQTKFMSNPNSSHTVISPAKVNLTLDVLGKEADYHRVQTVLHEVPEWHDTLTFTLREDDQIQLSCSDPELPIDDCNTIVQAVKLLWSEMGEARGVTIQLTKQIPVAAGLGGGSSNAAATLNALNDLWGLKLSVRKRRTLAAHIGMDVPFFITGGAAIGMHYGEQLMHLPTLQEIDPHFKIQIIPPDSPQPTQDAYAQLNLAQCGQRNRDTGRLVKLLKGDRELPEDAFSRLQAIEALLHNDFELNDPLAENHLSGSGRAQFKLWYLMEE
jgi:4-diphosphocytidyl-2C-methyl-D-erythritol kinase